jgi:hypothetical protein
VAERPKPRRKTVRDQPSIQVGVVDRFAVLIAPAINVVDAQKQELAFATTRTAVTVVLDHLAATVFVPNFGRVCVHAEA